MIDPQVAWDKIAQFQESEELRIFFQLEGIKGVAGHDTKCPIATWLQETTGFDTVSVSGSIRMWNCSDPSNFIEFEHTYTTERFINSFDGHQFPELMRYENE